MDDRCLLRNAGAGVCGLDRSWGGVEEGEEGEEEEEGKWRGKDHTERYGLYSAQQCSCHVESTKRGTENRSKMSLFIKEMHHYIFPSHLNSYILSIEKSEGSG